MNRGCINGNAGGDIIKITWQMAGDCVIIPIKPHIIISGRGHSLYTGGTGIGGLSV